MKLLALWLGLLCLPLTVGCLQRIDAELPATAQRADVLLDWREAGVFGGDAKLSVSSSDPYQVRYAPGGFLQIAGVCATADEVWVCDLGLSRIQVFDFNGKLLRTIGSGIPIAGTLITDEELEYQSANIRKISQTWQDGPGRPWVGTERELFKVADVQVTADGYWVADLVMTEHGIGAKRQPGLYFVPFDGGPIKRVTDFQPPWLAYVGYSNGILAGSTPPGNSVLLVDAGKAKPRSKRLGAEVQFLNIMRLRKDWRSQPGYEELERKVTNASQQPGMFYYPCGVAVAYDKLVVCDTYNHRLQVFDGRNRGQYWGQLLRLIMPRKLDGAMRFDIPRDIDIAPGGQAFVLDGGRNEVALLSSDFERLGSFARNDMALPWALDLSDDGRHCFITDQRTNQVYHYAAAD